MDNFDKNRPVEDIFVLLRGGIEYSIKGFHVPELETDNWHYYYAIDSGKVIHFRKEHMMIVESKEQKD